MNNAGGFITLHRKILEWEWFKDSNTLHLFIYLLLNANFADARFLGKKIKRGQLATSLPSLASGTGLSIQNVRTSLKRLISTGEVTDVSNRQYRIITIVKYDDYQNLTDKLTVSQQTANRQLTDSQQQYNNNNKNNKNNKETNKSKVAFTPPTLEEVEAYVREKGFSMDPGAFFDYFSQSGWVMKSGQKIKDWKAAARNWERREKNGFGSNGKQRESSRRVDYSFLPD